ncbi:MAG: hypothetical protein HPY59_14240 [Anaerolineae bacterium]|nr:hypothetical protein [Anaerolineae bacterium]
MQVSRVYKSASRLSGALPRLNRLFMRVLFLAATAAAGCQPGGPSSLSTTPLPTRTASPTPVPGCAALQAGKLAVSPPGETVAGGSLEVSLTNLGRDTITLLGAVLEKELPTWHISAFPPPEKLGFTAYTLDDLPLFNPPDSAVFPILHRFPAGRARLIPGRQVYLRWEFDRSFYVPLDSRQYPGVEPQLFTWGSDFKAILDYRLSDGQDCSLVLSGDAPPKIEVDYSGGSAAIYTPFWLRARLEGVQPQELRSLELFVHDSGGRLVHRRKLSGAASLCLFGGDPDCQPRRPLQDNWDLNAAGKGGPIAPGDYTLAVLAVTQSGSLLQQFPFTIAAPRPAALTASALAPTRTPIASRTALYPPGTLTPSPFAPLPFLPGAGTATLFFPSTLTIPPLPSLTFTPTITQTPTITLTPTLAITPTPSKTATRELTPTPTFCQTPLEGGGCQ